MIKFLRRLLNLCEHSWSNVELVSLYTHSGAKMPYARQMIQNCEKCRQFRRVDY